jgi:hypothetical protein
VWNTAYHFTKHCMACMTMRSACTVQPFITLCNFVTAVSKAILQASYRPGCTWVTALCSTTIQQCLQARFLQASCSTHQAIRPAAAAHPSSCAMTSGAIQQGVPTKVVAITADMSRLIMLTWHNHSTDSTATRVHVSQL